jgi:threonine synthase
VIYDYESLKRKVSEKTLFNLPENQKYLPLLPIKTMHSFPDLRIGKTPLYRHTIQEADGFEYEAAFKDDSQNPTFSFKDRASALVSAWAKEKKINTLVAASTGNAGSSLAGICAAQGQKALIFVPVAAPVAKLTQIVMYGATLIPVNGTYDQAFDMSILASTLYGYYNRNTAFNPLTVEGKKTAAYELFEQYDHHLPERIFVPVGDGVIISGIYKGFEELLLLGLIENMPILVAVQSDGSCNLVRNILAEKFTSKQSNTVADSISVDIPRNFYMATEYLKKYHGEILTLSDDEIMNASFTLASEYGLFSEPAAAAAYAGFIKYRINKKIGYRSKNLILLTGSGLKDVVSVKSRITIPSPVNPDPEELKHFLKSIPNWSV